MNILLFIFLVIIHAIVKLQFLTIQPIPGLHQDRALLSCAPIRQYHDNDFDRMATNLCKAMHRGPTQLHEDRRAAHELTRVYCICDIAIISKKDFKNLNNTQTTSKYWTIQTHRFNISPQFTESGIKVYLEIINSNILFNDTRIVQGLNNPTYIKYC